MVDSHWKQAVSVAAAEFVNEVCPFLSLLGLLQTPDQKHLIHQACFGVSAPLPPLLCAGKQHRSDCVQVV